MKEMVVQPLQDLLKKIKNKTIQEKKKKKNKKLQEEVEMSGGHAQQVTNKKRRDRFTWSGV